MAAHVRTAGNLPLIVSVDKDCPSDKPDGSGSAVSQRRNHPAPRAGHLALRGVFSGTAKTEHIQIFLLQARSFFVPFGAAFRPIQEALLKALRLRGEIFVNLSSPGFVFSVG